MIELTFLKILMLIRQVHQKSVLFDTIRFLDKSSKFQLAVCNRFHDVLMMSMNLNNIATLSTHGVVYHCIIGGTSKREAINLPQNVDLSKKVDHYKIQIFFTMYKR